MKDKTAQKEIIKYLKKHITEKRLDHTLGTAECAVKMAKIYDVKEKSAEVAALLHDCAKESKDKELIEKAKEYGFAIDGMYKKIPQLLHGAAGALVAKKKFGIKDKDILEAICYHTIPKPNLSDLAKVIYIADKIERTRIFDDVEEIRSAVEKRKPLDHVFLMTLKRVKLSQILNNKPVHPSSLDTYNHIVSSMKK